MSCVCGSVSRHARPRFCGLVTVLLSIAFAHPLTAQEVAGVVVRPDSTPVSGVLVELHRVTQSAGSVWDSMPSDERGRFRFDVRGEDDPGVVFLPSARYQGVLYWGRPVHGSAVEGDPAAQSITVFDTLAVSAPIPDLVVTLRHVIITPLASGLQVEEIIDLAGRKDRALVSVGDGTAVWRAPLALDAHGVLPGQGGVGAEVLDLADGTAAFTGVLPPTGVRIALGYFVPSDRYSLDVIHPTERLEILVAEVPRLEIEAKGIEAAPPDEDLGMSVRRFAAADVATGARVEMRAVIGTRARNAARTWFIIALVLGTAALVSTRLGRRARAGVAAGGGGR